MESSAAEDAEGLRGSRDVLGIWMELRAVEIEDWSLVFTVRGGDPPRNRTENLLIKSQLLCLIELAGHVRAWRSSKRCGDFHCSGDTF